jgi:dihydroorotate dehydrogenase electron transfer subunit
MSLSPPAAAHADGSRTRAPFGRRLAEVVARDDLDPYRLVWASDPDGPPDPRPGQFYMLAAAEGWGGGDGRPYLPRAFSHCRVTLAGPREGIEAPPPYIGFMLEAVGPGTERLALLEPGDGLWLLGPLGTGFRTPDSDPIAAGKATTPGGGRSLLVGGGIGTAPILALADDLGSAATVLLGFRSAAHSAVARLFASDDPRIATEDGSAGRHALVTELLREELDRDDAASVYACGPPPMLEAVRALCQARDVPAQLALESGMACGYGACFGCVAPTRDGFVRLCVDGPVLDADRLETALFEGAGH